MTNNPLTNPAERLDLAILAAADALLAVCAVQTGLSPSAAGMRAIDAIEAVMAQSEREARNG